MAYTDGDIQDLEQTIGEAESKDTVMLMREIKALKAEVAELKEKRSYKTKAQKKEEILSIKDTNERLKTIRENIDLFR